MSLNPKLVDERQKAYNLLKASTIQHPPQSFLSPLPQRKDSLQSINVSGLRNEKTIYLESTPKKDSPAYFDASEMTARSTMCQAKANPNSMFSSDLDQILQSSCVQDVRNLSEFYRESMDNMPNMSLPRTADISRASLANYSFKNQHSVFNTFSSASANPSDNLFDTNEFTPAEGMEDQLIQDEIAWDQEYAEIPSNPIVPRQPEQQQNTMHDSLWNLNADSQKNFSMGSFFKNKSEDLKCMIPNQSPVKIGRRKGFLEESIGSNASLSNQMSINYGKVRKALDQESIDSAKKHLTKKLTPPNQANKENYFSMQFQPEPDLNLQNPITNKKTIAEKDFQPIQCSKQTSELEQFLINEQRTKSFTDSMLEDHEISSLNRNFDNINLSLSERKERSRDPLRRHENVIEFSVRKNKRRSSSAAGEYTEAKDTPKSTMERPVKRSKSPNTMKELQAACAAAKLRPKIGSHRNPPQSAEKMRRHRNDSSGFKSGSSSAASSNFDSREYFSAKSSAFLQIPQTDSSGKLSLPSYSLTRPDFLPSSPSSSVKSSVSTFASPLKRTESQCSTQSEFNENFMPLKITHKKLSWESVKLRKSLHKSLNIQNISVKKLTLRVSVEGPGFQLDSSEIKMGLILFRSEVRSISVEFCPTGEEKYLLT